MTQEPISELVPPLSGKYYPDDREGLEESRKMTLEMIKEYEGQRWEQLVALMHGFSDQSNAERLAFYVEKEPGMADAPEPVWDLVMTGLKKFALLKVEYPALAGEIAMLAPWLCNQAALGHWPNQQAIEVAKDYRSLLKEQRRG